MMLWILAQDSECIVNVKEVSLEGKKIHGVIGSASLDDWSKVIGEYSTKERALEVLEDIFARIRTGQASFITYAMPED